MTNSENNSGFVVSDAIWVIALTAASYAIAFSYESGYAKHFSIPVSLITISPTLLLKTAGTLLGAAIPIFFIANAIWPLLPRSNTALARAVRLFAKQVAYLSLLFSPLLLRGEFLYFFIGVVVLMAFFEFVFPLITQRKEKTFESKMEAQAELEREAAFSSLLGTVMDHFGRGPMVLLLILLLCASFANLLGSVNAKSQTEFLVVKGEKNSVLLAHYDNTFVTQFFDEKSKVLTGNIKITRLGDGNAIELSSSKVGPLVSHVNNSAK